MEPGVLSELRILASADFDSASLLTVILCGDSLGFVAADLAPLTSLGRPQFIGYRSSPGSAASDSACRVAALLHPWQCQQHGLPRSRSKGFSGLL